MNSKSYIFEGQHYRIRKVTILRGVRDISHPYNSLIYRYLYIVIKYPGAITGVGYGTGIIGGNWSADDVFLDSVALAEDVDAGTEVFNGGGYAATGEVEDLAG